LFVDLAQKFGQYDQIKDEKFEQFLCFFRIPTFFSGFSLNEVSLARNILSESCKG